MSRTLEQAPRSFGNTTIRKCRNSAVFVPAYCEKSGSYSEHNPKANYLVSQVRSVTPAESPPLQSRQTAKDRVQNKFPNVVRASVLVIPAQAGNQFIQVFWFPAYAGMTHLEIGKLFRTHS